MPALGWGEGRREVRMMVRVAVVTTVLMVRVWVMTKVTVSVSLTVG